MNAQEIVERIMTLHWDVQACRCWVCEAGRQLGFHARSTYLRQDRTHDLNTGEPRKARGV